MADSEDSWFAKHEEELLRQARRDRKRREEEQVTQDRMSRERALREAHWMKCPKCGHDLAEQDLSGVRIDRCEHCEGIFLDRGELEQIVLASAEDRRGLFRRLLGFGR